MDANLLDLSYKLVGSGGFAFWQIFTTVDGYATRTSGLNIHGSVTIESRVLVLILVMATCKVG